MNNEFLKGIKARERLVTLKKIHTADSLQLRIYQDSLIPYYEDILGVAKVEIEDLNSELIQVKAERKFFQYTSLGLVILTTLLIIF